MSKTSKWQPTNFERFEEAFDSSMGTARIITDAGPAYIKALGNRQGPHPLACEWIGTHLASWLGLPTFDFALITIDATTDEIPLPRGRKAASGTAFVTRAESGHTWGGSPEELQNLLNPKAVSQLVVFDTWTRNCDRYPPDLKARKANYDNVFLSDFTDTNGPKQRLMAMDHTHCFTCGRDLDGHVAKLDWVKDDRLYGMFPAFCTWVREDDIQESIDRLQTLERAFVTELAATIPNDWDVTAAARRALIDLICRRGEFVADTILRHVKKVCWPEKLFDTGK